MQDEEGFIQKTQQFATKIANAAKRHENILVVSHQDADGICSSVMISDFIFKNSGHCEIRTVSEANARVLQRIAQSKFDLVLFVDIASGLSEEITKHLGDRWLIIDHHSIPEDETEGSHSSSILNPWQFGFDGSREIACAGIVHLLTEKMRSDISYFFTAVGSIADGQDVGPKRSLVGLNAKIVEDAKNSSKPIETRVDLLFSGRDTKPVHEAVANTISSFIPGLTGNKDACLATLRGSGLELKYTSRWKIIPDFNEEEKKFLLEAIVPHLSGTTSTVEDLVGTVYCLKEYDEFSPMHDARDFGAILSACGRRERASIGIALCIGGWPELAEEMERIVSEYRVDLVRAIQSLTGNPDKVLEKENYVLILGDGIVPEGMTGAVCQALSTLNRSKNKILLLRTVTSDGDVKISARLGRGADADLGAIMRNVSRRLQGAGGGHWNRAGGRFSIARQQEFQMAVEAQFQTLRAS